MRYYTHLAFSFFIGIILIRYLSIQNQVLFIFLFLLASLLPDIDEVKSKISEKVKPISWLVHFMLGHRGLMHSIWIPIILYLSLFLIRIDVAIAVSFGYLSHILIDGLTVSGVPLLWPLKKHMRGFIHTASLVETLVFLALLAGDFYLLFTF